MAGSPPVHKTELTERQNEFLSRALKGDRLPILKRGHEIRGRVNALSLERQRLEEEFADLERTKSILNGYAKQISGGIKSSASGTREEFVLRAELDVVKRHLTKVQNKLNEYGELDIRPHGWAKIFSGGWLTGSSTGVAAEFSAVATLIALDIAVTPAALAATVAIGLAVGLPIGAKAAGKLEKGAEQAKKEMAAVKKICDVMGIKEDHLEKGIWCLRNGVPITANNLERDKNSLLRVLRQDMRDKKEFYKIINGKVAVLSDPSTGYSAYFYPADRVAVICANNKLHKGIITHYGDGTRDAVQYPYVRWPLSAADRELSRMKFEDDLKAASALLLARKKELDHKIDVGEISTA